MFFSLSTLYFTFLLGEKLYNKKTGFFAGLLLFFSPFFFAQCGLLYCDMLVTALSTAAIYYFVSGKRRGYLIAATLLVLTKEPAILTVIAIGIYQVILNLPEFTGKSRREEVSSKTKKLILETLFILSPLLFFLVWMILNKLLLGWFFFPLFTSLLERFSLFPDLMKWILRWTFREDFRIFFTGAVILAAFLSLFKKDIRKGFLKNELLLFAILSLISILFFAGIQGKHYGFSMRYLLFLQPLLFLAGTAAVIQLIKNKIAHTLVFLFSIFIFINCWHSRGLPQKDDLNLDYLNIVKIHKEAAGFLAKKFSSRLIVAALPVNNNLTLPVRGYVNRPLANVVDVPPETASQGTIIVVSKYYRIWTDQAEEVIKFQQKTNAALVKKFSRGDEEISIYALP
jgi:hypothetical protein